MQRYEVILIIKNLLKNDPKKKIHISLSNGRFFNGVVLNYEDEETIDFMDNKLGYVPVSYSRILNIEPMIEK